jgi:hypothetical protein
MDNKKVLFCIGCQSTVVLGGNPAVDGEAIQRWIEGQYSSGLRGNTTVD